MKTVTTSTRWDSEPVAFEAPGLWARVSHMGTNHFCELAVGHAKATQTIQFALITRKELIAVRAMLNEVLEDWQ